MTQHAVHLASLYYRTPLLMGISLVSQAGTEIVQAYHEERTPERCVNLLMAAIRLYSASQYLPRQPSQAPTPVQEENKQVENKPETVEEMRDKPPILPESNPTVENETLPTHDLPPQAEVPAPQVETDIVPAESSPKAADITPAYERSSQAAATANDTLAVCERSLAPQKPLTIETRDKTPNSPESNSIVENERLPLYENSPEVKESGSVQENAAQIPLRKMTQKDWDIFAKNNPDYIKDQLLSSTSSKFQTETLFDVKAALQNAGFSSDLEGLSLKNRFNNCRFVGLNFKNCNFEGTNFYRCLFDQVTLDNCSFKWAKFYSLSIANSNLIDCNFSQIYFRDFNDLNCEIINSEFHSCKFNKTSFHQTQIIHSKFYNSTFVKSWLKKCGIEKALLKDCDLSSAFIQNSIVKETSLQQADLEDTHWIESTVDHLKVQEGNLYQCVFFETTVSNSQLVDCDLKNALLLDAKKGFQISGGIPHQMTGPIVALGWNFNGADISYTKLIRKALIDQGALVIKYSQTEEASVDLQREIIRELAGASSSEESIGQQLLKKAAINSEIALIRQRAANILKIAQGLVIPGGADIEACFYRQEAAGSMITYRSLMELALIAEAQRLQIPTLGVCRGAQMINVYFGGTLKNVEGQWQKQQLEWTGSSYGEQLKTLLPKDFVGYSSHYQAADRIGEGLQVVLKHGNIPKLMIRENFIASQFHPEEYINKLKNNPILDGNLSVKKNLEIVDNARRTLNDTLENMPTNTPFEIAAKDALTVFLETPFEDLEKARKNVMFISSNRNFYEFFIKKITSSNPTGSSPPL